MRWEQSQGNRIAAHCSANAVQLWAQFNSVQCSAVIALGQWRVQCILKYSAELSHAMFCKGPNAVKCYRSAVQCSFVMAQAHCRVLAAHSSVQKWPQCSAKQTRIHFSRDKSSLQCRVHCSAESSAVKTYRSRVKSLRSAVQCREHSSAELPQCSAESNASCNNFATSKYARLLVYNFINIYFALFQ